MEPGMSLLVNSLRLTTPLKGKPLAIPCYKISSSHIDTSFLREYQIYLGHHHDIRSHTAVLNSEILTSPTEPGLYFVNYEKYPMLIAHFAQSLKVRRRCWDIAAFSDHGLDKDSCGLAW